MKKKSKKVLSWSGVFRPFGIQNNKEQQKEYMNFVKWLLIGILIVGLVAWVISILFFN